MLGRPLTPGELAEIDHLLDLVSAKNFAALMANPRYRRGLRQLERYDLIRAWPVFAGFGVTLLCLIAAFLLI